VRSSPAFSTNASWRCGSSPITPTAESPLPTPQIARPPETTWTAAIEVATTDGWRVTMLVAPVASLIVVVASAAARISANGSETKHEFSPK
jgi:hypothetical protein